MVVVPQVPSHNGVAVFGRSATRCGAHCLTVSAVCSHSARLVAVLALQFAITDRAIGQAVERPTVEALRNGHSELRRASRNVQGTIRVYRTEAAIPEALDEEPSQLGIPLVREGNVWRSDERFRADFTTYDRRGDAMQQSEHSFAVDGGKVYEFSGGNLEIGMLRVCDSSTDEAVSVMGSIRTMFSEPIEALWNVGGVALVDMLQRPSTEIVPNIRLVGGYSLLTSTDDGRETRFELEPLSTYPFGYVSASEEGAGIVATVERRVLSAERDGMVFPTRIVHVASLGPDAGYTEVTMLDLEPLEADSPIASRITSESFRNFGAGYQVYNIRSTGKQELGGRYERPIPVPPGPANTIRTFFLWANGVVIIGIVAYLTYRRLKRRQTA